MKKRSNFTLIELMVVVIIVGILAGAAVPIYIAQTNRAKTAEAIAGCGAIRSAQRVYYTEYNAYKSVDEGDISNSLTNGGLKLDFSQNKYFGNGSYSVSVSGTTYTIQCDGTPTASGVTNDAPAQASVSEIIVQMNEKGQTKYSYDDGSNYDGDSF